MKIKEKVTKLYNRIKLAIYKNMFHKSDNKEEEITSSEYFCLQCIYLLDKPTISTFAQFLDISAPNATYRVKKLIKKGYITKQQTKDDKREFVLMPTEKFFDIIKNKEDQMLINDLQMGLSDEEKRKVEEIMKILNEKKENA